MEEKKKGNKTWLVVLGVLLIIAAIAVLVPSYIKDNMKDETTVEKDTDKIPKDVKNKLERWVTVASYYNGVGYTSTLEKFGEGLTELDDKTKLEMTYNAVYADKKIEKQERYSLTIDDIAKMQTSIDKSQMTNEPVKIMKISDFNTTYEELFNEDSTYTLKDLNFGCPTPWGMDESQDRLYLFERCGGTATTNPDYKKLTYDSDDNYYFVHQKVDIHDGAQNNIITKSYKIVWLFDKEANFISTEEE